MIRSISYSKVNSTEIGTATQRIMKQVVMVSLTTGVVWWLVDLSVISLETWTVKFMTLPEEVGEYM